MSNTIKYQVTARQTNLIKIQFLAMDELVRGKHPDNSKPLFKTVEGYTLCSHFWPCYYEHRKLLYLPGRDMSSDRTAVTIPIMHWDGVMRVLSAVGAVMVEDLTKVEPQYTDVPIVPKAVTDMMQYLDRYGVGGEEMKELMLMKSRNMGHTHMQMMGDTHIGAIEKDPIVIHRMHGRKLEFERAADWSWIRFTSMDPKLIAKGRMYEEKINGIRVRISSQCYPELDTEDEGRTLLLYVIGTDKDRSDEHERIDIPDRYRGVVAIAFSNYESKCGVTQSGESGWAVNMESLKRSQREMCRVQVDPAVAGMDRTVIGIINAAVASVINEGEAGMIKQNVKQLVAELTAVKAAFEAAVKDAVGDVDAKVAQAWL